MKQVVPIKYIQPCSMERIILHWTAGPGKSRRDEWGHYHFVIDQDLVINPGKAILANANTKDGDYAAHTLNCNQGSIGVSMAGMRQAVERPFNPGPDPITEAQWNLTLELIAQLAVAYKIPTKPTTILTHAEVQDNLKIQQRGKWDITILPWNQTVNTAREVGDLMRTTVQRIIDKK